MALECFSFLLSLLLHTSYKETVSLPQRRLACALAIQCFAFALLLSMNHTCSACAFMTSTHRALEYQATQCGKNFIAIPLLYSLCTHRALEYQATRCWGATSGESAPSQHPGLHPKTSKVALLTSHENKAKRFYTRARTVAAVLHACMPLKTRSEAFF